MPAPSVYASRSKSRAGERLPGTSTSGRPGARTITVEPDGPISVTASTFPATAGSKRPCGVAAWATAGVAAARAARATSTTVFAGRSAGARRARRPTATDGSRPPRAGSATIRARPAPNSARQAADHAGSPMATAPAQATQKVDTTWFVKIPAPRPAP